MNSHKFVKLFQHHHPFSFRERGSWELGALGVWANVWPIYWQFLCHHLPSPDAEATPWNKLSLSGSQPLHVRRLPALNLTFLISAADGTSFWRFANFDLYSLLGFIFLRFGFYQVQPHAPLPNLSTAGELSANLDPEYSHNDNGRPRR